MTQSSVYEQIGGQPALQAAVDEFYRRVLADPSLAPYFTHTDLDRLKAHQRAFLAAAFGGPQLFHGRGLHDAHAHLAITDAAFDRIVATLIQSLGDLGAPAHAVGAIAERLETVRGDIVTA